jgi:hypothetical protein
MGCTAWQAHNRRVERSDARGPWPAVIALFVVLGVVGLALQLAASWASLPGDAVWAAAALTFSFAVVVESRRSPRNRRALVSIVALALFGLSVAAVMFSWILIDAGRIERFDPRYLALPVGLGLIGLAASFAPGRRSSGA